MAKASEPGNVSERSSTYEKPLPQILDEVDNALKAVHEASLKAEKAAQKTEILISLLAETKAGKIILDSAIIRERQGETSRPFSKYLAERKKRTYKA